jgi:ADP-dependent NAD(P)H-hydrate dehydratase
MSQNTHPSPASDMPAPVASTAPIAPITPIALDAQTLRDWPLPIPADDDDKEARGRVLVIAGCREMPGGAILACNAALRAGVGKLTLVTAESVAVGIALAVPEARVVAMPDDVAQWLDSPLLDEIRRIACRADGVLIGPGMSDDDATAAFTDALLAHCAHARVVLDAGAMGVVTRRPMPLPQPVLLTPHAGEMAHLTGAPKAALRQAPAQAAQAASDAAKRWGAVVALKGACTLIATPQGQLWRHEGGNVGLAVSGSGDTLSGLMAGLLARGASLEQAAAWSVVLHASAGEQLARRWGLLGYLAREIPGEVPRLMAQFSS